MTDAERSVMRPTRKQVAAAVAACLVALVAIYAFSVQPEHASQVSHARDGHLPEHLSTRTLGVMRYDEATDTTVAVLPCGHGFCDQAIRLRGDHTATGEFNTGGGFGSWILTGPRKVETESLNPPLAVRDGANVTTVLVGTFDARPLNHDVLYVSALLAGAGAAGLVLLGRGLQSAGIALPVFAAAAWFGANFGAFMRSGFQEFGAWVLFAWFAIALSMGIRGRWRTSIGQVALGTFLVGMICLRLFWSSFSMPLTD